MGISIGIINGGVFGNRFVIVEALRTLMNINDSVAESFHLAEYPLINHVYFVSGEVSTYDYHPVRTGRYSSKLRILMTQSVADYFFRTEKECLHAALMDLAKGLVLADQYFTKRDIAFDYVTHTLHIRHLAEHFGVEPPTLNG